MGLLSEKDFDVMGMGQFVAFSAQELPIFFADQIDWLLEYSHAMHYLSTPKIQHQPAAEIKILEKHCGIITKHLQRNRVVIAGGFQ